MKRLLLSAVLSIIATSAFAGGFNGSGTYNRFYNWQNDKANNIDITASRFDTEDNGFALGLSTTITKDGQQTTSARIPFALGISADAGSPSAPGYSIIGDLQTGIYQSATGHLDLSISGTRVGGFDSNGLDNTPLGAGTPASGSFTTLTSTGVASIGTSAIGSSSLNVFGNLSVGVGEIATAAPTNGIISQGNIIDSGTLISVGSVAIGTNALGTTPLTLNGITTGQILYGVGTSAIAGTTALPNGTTATTQSSGDSSTKVASTAFANPGSSLGTSGWTELPNGLLFEWGTTSVSSSGTAITFPQAFSTAFYGAFTGKAVGSATVIYSSPSTTGMTATLSGGGPDSTYWMVIGK